MNWKVLYKNQILLGVEIMSFRLAIEGKVSIQLEEDQIINAIYRTDTPDDSNARSTEVGSELRIIGKIVKTGAERQSEDTVNMARWSLVPAAADDCYRQITLEVIAAGQVTRKIVMPNAFVVDYLEDFGANQGIGTFTLVVRQKKDRIENVVIAGLFSEEEA
jgi:hypothetical protein